MCQNLTKQHKKLKYFKKQIHKQHTTTKDPTLQLEITIEARRPGVARSLPKRSTKKGTSYSHITLVLNSVDKECTELRCQFCLFLVEAWKRRVLEHRRRLCLLSAPSMSPFGAVSLLGDASPTWPSAGPLQPTASIQFVSCCL